jgi:hypothetical protein
MRMASEAEIQMHKICAKYFFLINDKKLILCRKTAVRPTQRVLQKLPIKPSTRILFAIRRHMFVARDVMQLVVLCNGCAQAAEGFVLRRLEGEPL